MSLIYSENEIVFLKQIILDYNLRLDGREKMEIRPFHMKENNLKTCFNSLKLSYNNNKNEIIFAIKGEIISYSNSLKNSDLISLSIDSFKNSEQTLKTKTEIENILNELIISQIDINFLIVPESKNLFIWKIFIDIFIFDEMKISLMQIISIGLNKLLKTIKFPKIIIFDNKIDKTIEYDLISNYKENNSFKENEYSIDLNPPNFFIFAILNNLLFLDPNDEEIVISNSIIFLSEINQKIIKIKSIGNFTDPVVYFDLENVIKTLK